MSIVFSESTNKTGLCELLDDELGTNTTSYPLAKKARDFNMSIDALLLLLWGGGAGGSGQLDDTNHTAYPIITTNLVDGQRDYPFTTDEQGNVILDVFKVMAKDSANGVFRELTPCDQQSGTCPITMTDGQNREGIPTHYDKTGNAIFLDLIPSYNSTNGLKIWINREASYFSSSDTTKKLGFTGLYHEYIFLRTAYRYARSKGFKKTEQLKRDYLEVEDRITRHQGVREKDIVRRITVRQENNK